MIRLHVAGEGFGLPEISPYACKAEIFLKMAGLDYDKLASHPDGSPKGQLPWLDDDGELIADSHFIRLHLERKYGVDFDAGLTAAERAQAWAIERMIENHFGWTLAGIRWLDEANYAKGPAQFFANLPAEVQTAVKAEVQDEVAKASRAVGIGRHTPQEVFNLGDRSLSALSVLLGDKAFLMADRPTSLDAIGFGMLAGLMTPYFDAPLRERALTYPNLVAYVDRMMAGCYPEFAWTPLAARPMAA